MEKDRNIRNAELARRKAEIAYKKENVYNQDKVRMTTDARFFYDMFDITDNNEVLYKSGDIPNTNEDVDAVLQTLINNKVLLSYDHRTAESMVNTIKDKNIEKLNMIQKEINVKEITDLIAVLRKRIYEWKSTASAIQSSPLR